jgi:hypothetical protein
MPRFLLEGPPGGLFPLYDLVNDFIIKHDYHH